MAARANVARILIGLASTWEHAPQYLQRFEEDHASPALRVSLLKFLEEELGVEVVDDLRDRAGVEQFGAIWDLLPEPQKLLIFSTLLSTSEDKWPGVVHQLNRYLLLLKQESLASAEATDHFRLLLTERQKGSALSPESQNLERKMPVSPEDLRFPTVATVYGELCYTFLLDEVTFLIERDIARARNAGPAVRLLSDLCALSHLPPDSRRIDRLPSPGDLSPFARLWHVLGIQKSQDQGATWVPLLSPPPVGAAIVPLLRFSCCPRLLEEASTLAAFFSAPHPSQRWEKASVQPQLDQLKAVMADFEGKTMPALQVKHLWGDLDAANLGSFFLYQAVDGPCGLLAVFNYLLLGEFYFRPNASLARILSAVSGESGRAPFSMALGAVLNFIEDTVNAKVHQRTIYEALAGLAPKGTPVPLPPLDFVYAQATQAANLSVDLCRPGRGADVDPRLDGAFGGDPFAKALSFLGIP